TFLDASGNPLTNSTITLAPGASTASFEYEDTALGAPTLTVAADGFSATQQEIVTGAPTGLIFATLPQSLTLDQASGLLTVRFVDENGHPSTAGRGGVTLTLCSTPFRSTFLDASGNPLANSRITIAPGATTASFEYRDAALGMPTLTAAATSFSTTQQET